MQPQNLVYSAPHLPGAGVFAQAAVLDPGPPSYRNSHSATDLQELERRYGSSQIHPFAIPQDQSQTTSATLTPKNLSRQASPSAPSGQNKRRKASGSGRLRSDLVMTKLETSSSPSCQTGYVSAFAPSYVTTPQALHMQPTYPQTSTNPATPNTTDGSFHFFDAQRSQSMENMQNRPVFSAPASQRPSRVPSPTSEPLNSNPTSTHFNNNPTSTHLSNHFPQAHTQILTNSLATITPSPRIYEVTPSHGSKSGGTRVACLGEGFSGNFTVMFGDAPAITTTDWGERALHCIVPREFTLNFPTKIPALKL